MLLAIELGLVLIALAAAIIAPSFGAKQFESLERSFATIARRPTLAILLVMFSALGMRLMLLPVVPIPEPVYHDDFCYLLAADTFAHARLTNPTHPMWVHFETFGVIHQPSYQCVAQPAQGLLLAFGKVVLGNPFWGVWLSLGLMCGAICWMLQGWMPARWALLGGLLAVVRFGVFGYWANTYWGGALAATGGALVLGALPRIKRSLRTKDALLLCLGLAILANTRPYEGLILSLAILLTLAIWAVNKGRARPQALLSRLIVPSLCCGMVVVSCMAYYNWRVTGSPLTTAYQVQQNAYGIPSYFLWGRMKSAPSHDHQFLGSMYTNQLAQFYSIARSPSGQLLKLWQFWKFYCGPALTVLLVVALLTLPPRFRWRDLSRRTRTLILISAVFLLALSMEVFFEAHYAAPITSAFIAFIMLSMRRLLQWRIGKKSAGLFFVRAILMVLVAAFALRATAGPLHIWLPGSTDPAWFESQHASSRSAVLARLDQLPGCHLVIVRYKKDRLPVEEWVYNEANIDRAKVVWAQELTPAENEALINYFRDRDVWLVEADERPPRLSPFPKNSDVLHRLVSDHK